MTKYRSTFFFTSECNNHVELLGNYHEYLRTFEKVSNRTLHILRPAAELFLTGILNFLKVVSKVLINSDFL